jgi:Undecaprenyl-phosphate glucose phosphotransferase
MLKKHSLYLSLLQRTLDTVVVAVAWALAYHLRFNIMGGAQQGLASLFAKVGVFLVIATSYYFHKEGLYRSQRFSSRIGEILSVAKANSTSFLALVVILYFTAPERVSRVHLMVYFLISTPALIIARLIVRNFLRSLRRRGHNLRHVLLIGNSEQLVSYVKTVRNFKDCGIKVVGWKFSEGLAEAHGVAGVNEGISLKDIVCDGVVVGFKASDSHKLEEFLKENYNSLSEIKVIPDLSYSYLGTHYEEFAGITLLSMNEPRLNPLALMTKRIFDFSLTAIGLIIISPLLLAISIAVKLSSPGPILFGQKRMGIDGRLFTMWKFRSMRVSTDGTDTREWSNKENPRKTRVGDFLRRTSLDELPQIFNVLLGSMSLVGPRPEQPFFVEKFKTEIPGYMLRHKMKAGITGWAQVNGWRGDTSLEKRIECDIFYIKNWSLWFDIKILFLTFFKGFVNKNAY